MEFFDKKEEVLDIQITPLGKRLMQMGQFKPHSYAFFDNDIIYDSKFAGVTETQNNTQERIKEVPRLKQQVYLYSPEEKINSNTEDIDLVTYNENLFQDKSVTGPQSLASEYNIQKQESRQLELESFGPLGNMAFHADSIPAWDIRFFEATLTGSTSIVTTNNQRIPNLDCDVQYKFNLKSIDLDMIEEPEDEALLSEIQDNLFITTTPVSKDGSYLELEPEAFFIRASENNTNFLNDNFDIEIFKVGSEGEEQQLFFDDEGTSFEDSPLAVEYWFNVEVDAEIPDSIYCKQVKSEKLEVTYTDKFLFNCDDLIDENLAVDQIYNIPAGDTEPCD
tara:strand:+ start:10184 stop:11188 length:1005 start_codon:yes stop_codon:yes gene_type:complete